MKLLYGTTNQAKLSSMRECLAPLGIELIGLKELAQSIPAAPEDGATPLENARQKARCYYEAFHMPVFSCDSGLYFENVPDAIQPGIHVRNVGGKTLTDDEMLGYYSGLAKQYNGLIARYKNAICLVLDKEHTYESMDDRLSGARFKLISTPHTKREAGFPLDCISVKLDSGRYFYDEPRGDVFGSTMSAGFQDFFRKALGL